MNENEPGKTKKGGGRIYAVYNLPRTGSMEYNWYMTIFGDAGINGVLLAGWLFLIICCASASGAIASYLGDTITLQGYSYGNPVVYLFLTGPNLPVNGVALDDITARADEGYFTEVSVDGNDHWVYTWSTHAIGGRLDPGAYTVWAVNGPNDRSHLGGADYSTISLSLGAPAVTVDTPVIPGSLALTSVPDGASVVVDDIYRGATPLTTGGIEPGTHTVTFSRFGYSKLSLSVNVEPGRMTEVNGTLHASTGSLVVDTDPAGAHLQLDNASLGPSPVSIANITVGNHTLTATKEGYSPSQQTVHIVSNMTLPVHITLAAPTPTRAAAVLPGYLIGIFSIILLGSFQHVRSRR
jgi:hypothetical protein